MQYPCAHEKPAENRGKPYNKVNKTALLFRRHTHGYGFNLILTGLIGRRQTLKKMPGIFPLRSSSDSVRYSVTAYWFVFIVRPPRTMRRGFEEAWSMYIVGTDV